jgi:hypothetical protein
MTGMCDDRPIPDPYLEGKFNQACQTLDQFLSDLERLNLHAPDVARYMGPVIETAGVLALELKRLRTRLFVPRAAPYPVRSLQPVGPETRQTTRARLVRDYQQHMKGSSNEHESTEPAAGEPRLVLPYGRR